MVTAGEWQSTEAHWAAEYVADHSDRVVQKLEELYIAAHPRGLAPSQGDVASWRNSVFELAATLKRLGRGNVRMFVEYRVAKGMDPIDVVLAGCHPNGRFSFLTIELKQWSSVARIDSSRRDRRCPRCKTLAEGEVCQQCAQGDKVLAPLAGKDGKIDWMPKAHPAVQVRKNLDHLRTHHCQFDDRYVNLVGAAWLHNLGREDAQWIRQVPVCGDIPVFTDRNPAELEKFLEANLTLESGAKAAEALLERHRTAALLTTEIGAIVSGRTEFSLIGNQMRAVNDILSAFRQPSSYGPKKVFVISGRPGTGKTVVALTLLNRALKEGFDARYVSGGIASRDTFRRAAPGHGAYFPTLNTLASNYQENDLDLILCDESHRLPERPMRGSFAMRQGESSVAVVVSRAKVPVIFIDGDQRLFREEVWSPEELNTALRQLGVEIVPIALDRVLRAVGSATYDTWIMHLLAGKPLAWDTGTPEDSEPFKLCYTDSPQKMEEFIRDKELHGATARITAGLCWPWSDLNPDGTLVPDVKIGRWARPWNAPDQHGILNVPRRKFWATDPGGLGQIGCVHTAQGLEYEWGGVIMGGDLTWNEGKWVVDRGHVLSKAARFSADDELERAIRNAYGVLMTRSIRGTVLYSVDPDTRRLFADLGLRKV
jgi:uncharacterized protein